MLRRKIVTAGNIGCTMDVMQCPDGSYVGRTGPKCEFTCPQDRENIKSQDQGLSTSTIDTLAWKTYQNTKYGYSIQYPSNIYFTQNCIGEEFLLNEKRNIDTKYIEETSLVPHDCGRDSPYDLELRTFQKKDIPKFPYSNPDYLVKKEIITIDKMPAEMYTIKYIGIRDEFGWQTWEQVPDAQVFYVYVNRDDRVHSIWFYDDNKNKKDGEKMFLDIITTLSFN